jgi:2-iminoacetate synthase ThiH
MNLEQEIKDLKFRLKRIEAGIETILEAEATILKSLQRDDQPNPISKEQWLEKLKQVQQDKQGDV